jgi:hypothetical protein
MNRNHNNTSQNTKLSFVGVYIGIIISMVAIMLFGMILVNILPPYDMLRFSYQQKLIEYQSEASEQAHNDLPYVYKN